MNRMAAFNDRCLNHPHYRNLARRLTEAEFDELVAFLEDRKQLSRVEFAASVNREFTPPFRRAQSPRMLLMVELLVVANSAATDVPGDNPKETTR